MKPDGNKQSSKKSNTAIILPGCTELYQPNRLTYGRYKSFTLLQSRILITLIKELQQAVLASMNGKDWQNLTIFLSKESNLIRVPIRLMDIAHPRQYKEIYEAALQLGKASVRLPSSISKEYYCIATLFPRVELPKIVAGNSVMYVEIFKDAARKLIEIDRTSNDRPGYFTRYLYEVAMNATNKYTYKLYMIISSWKQKGGFRITLQELKLQMGITADEYAEYYDFKKRVLLPVQKDLEHKSDCWFNCSVAGFEERDHRKKVIWLNFKIIVPAPEHIVKEKSDYIKYLLRSSFSFSDNDFKPLDGFFKKLITTNLIEQVLLKLQDLKDYINQTNRTNAPIYNVSRYVTKALLNQF